MTTESSDESDSRVAAAVTDSWLVAAVVGVVERLSLIGHRYNSTGVVAWGRRVVTGSLLYRWLTADLGSEVVVVDLRETDIAGSIIGLFDRFFAQLDDAAMGSRTVAIGREILIEFYAAPFRLVSVAVALGCAGMLLVSALLGAISLFRIIVLIALTLGALAGMQVTISWENLIDSRGRQPVIDAIKLTRDDLVSDGPDVGDDGSE